MAYYQDLSRAREDATKEFFAQNSLYSEIIDLVRDVLPRMVLSIERECVVIKYAQSLMASFVRTAFVVIELIIKSELVEATTLNRKQIELLARLRELESIPIEKLRNKTPNLKHLKTRLKKLYPSYSESAHSSNYAAFSLLGSIEGRTRRNHVLYPEFTENTEIIFQNWLSIYFEFTLWVLDFKTANIAGYSRDEDAKTFQGIFDLYTKSGLKNKFDGKPGNNS